MYSAIIGNPSLKIFRWLNLLPLPTKDDLEPKDISRVFMIESRMNPISRGEYLNPFIGDLSQELLQDIYKCTYFQKQKDVNLNGELDSVL